MEKCNRHIAGNLGRCIVCGQNNISKYQYKEVPNLEKANELGEDGWEIVFIKFFDSGNIANIVMIKN